MCMSRLKQMFKFLPFVRRGEKSLSTPRKIFYRAIENVEFLSAARSLEILKTYTIVRVNGVHSCCLKPNGFSCLNKQGL